MKKPRTPIKMVATVNRILAVVDALREDGYITSNDFDFYYIPPGFDQIGRMVEQGYATFDFYNEELAVMFALKYT
jgi:hypothetical protein